MYLFFSLSLFLTVTTLSATGATKQALHVLLVSSTNFEGIGPSKTTPSEREAGNTARAADFTRFLGEHFTRVTSIRAAAFTLELAAQADVIVADETVRVAMPDDFRVPLVAIGQMGMQTLGARGSKMDWLCACLDEKLHHVRTDHAIFRGPLPVEPTLVSEVDKTTRLPIRSWKVHSRIKTPGMVTSLANLQDAPDCEIIAGGINLKGDHAIALAREANLFLWGPAGAPSEMTEEARRVFINTLVYMTQFKGQRPTVRRGMPTRKEVNGIIDSPHITSVGQFSRYFFPEVLAATGNDKAKLHATFDGNEPWVYVPPGTLCFDIDQEAKSLGLANNDVRFLDRCVETMTTPAETAKARRLLERYTGLSFEDEAGWKGWLEQNRARLYFSDAYGYRFYSGPAGPLPAEPMVREALRENAPPATSDAAPVMVSGLAIGVQGHSYARVGDRLTLAVSIRVGEGWHLYDSVPEGNPMATTTVDVVLPESCRWEGEWQSTPPVREIQDKQVTGVMLQTGEVIYLRNFYVTTSSPVTAGRKETVPTVVAGSVTYQACDEQQCLPPAKIDFAAPLKIWGK
jgi:hypothetical protein